MTDKATSAEAMSAYRKLRKDGRNAEGLTHIQNALRRDQITDDGLVQAGQMIAADLADAAGEGATSTKVFIVGQCTTSFFVPVLTAVGWAQDMRLEVREGNFDNVLQDVMTLDWQPDIIIVVPWHQRLLSGLDRSPNERVDAELGFLQQVWNSVQQKGAKLIQVGYDWIIPGSLGYAMSTRLAGDVAIVRQMNSAIRETLPDSTFFVELEHISATAGHAQFYDQRNYYWMKQPFTPTGLAALARHLGAGVRALTQGQRKLLVLDLDNTLWGGVVGETAPLGIEVGSTPQGEAFAAFQTYAKKLLKTGILLAVCSKNNEADARAPFAENDEMVLSLDDFASFQASWDPKPVAIQRIADELRLGLNSFVFFDDNPAEREIVRQHLPEVQVVEVPEDPSDFTAALQESLGFEAATITEADAQRAKQYSEERQRRDLQQSTGSLEDYLESLDMVATVQPIDERNLGRVVQLITKTNQFNLTVRRHSTEQVQQKLEGEGAIGVALGLTDKFGDYGIVSVVLGEPDGDGAIVLDTWLMSCRAIGRTVEHFLVNHVAELAHQLGAAQLVGEFVPAAKNSLVAELYPSFGFGNAGDEGGEGTRRFVLELANFDPRKTHVRAAAP